jgi:hypothetical protein
MESLYDERLRWRAGDALRGDADHFCLSVTRSQRRRAPRSYSKAICSLQSACLSQLSEAGNRAKDVQALLRLDEIEKLRVVLQKISNACSKDVGSLERVENDAATLLLSALNIARLGSANL